MTPGRPLPRDVKKAVDLLRGDISRPWRIADIARLCGVGRRTLEKHFRRFAGCAPLEFLLAERLERARRKLVRAPPDTSVTEIAVECGFNHPGRFALAYRDRYGESPSETLRCTRISTAAGSPFFRAAACLDRPAIAVTPFHLAGRAAECAADLHQEIALAFGRTGWIRIVPPPAGRYHLHGTVIDDGRGRVRVRAMLLDRSGGGYIWADCWDYASGKDFEPEDWLSGAVTRALRAIVRDSEISRASGSEPDRLSPWQLTMRALPMVLAADPAVQGAALELLGRASELAPRDPVPMALAAWSHGLRAGHHFTAQQHVERKAALALASRASTLGIIDPLADALLSAAHALNHDLPSAEMHARRALAADGGSAWAWGRLAWVHAYRGQSPTAIECCRIARALSPADPLEYLWSLGIASAHFEHCRYPEAIRWYRRSLAEQPKAVWINRFLAPALALAGRRDEARHAFAALSRAFTGLTIAAVRTGVPNTPQMLDRVAEGLESLGMPVS
jgi:AraC-like DNA-binding protein/tetratricopeptide (TPR) repeat protein